MGVIEAAQLVQLIIQVGQAGYMIYLMNQITNPAWLLGQARKWGITFDRIMIDYANAIYGYFIQIVEGTLFTPEIIDGLKNRVYILVGIFIFFKLCTIMLRYIVAPEQFLDAKAGGEKLFKRILIGSAIIVALPLIFDIAMGIQKAVIKDGVIERILLPEDIYAEVMSDKENVGRQVGMMIFRGFFSWNENIPKYSTAYSYYEKMVAYDKITDSIEKNINNKVGNDDQYCFSYVPIISTLAIGYYLVTLIKYAMEVAMRSIKLVFLQLVAPFSIVKYMLDPADDESLKKWLNVTISTYILIFVRVFTIWFISLMAYYLKNGIPSSNGVTSLITAESDEILKALIVVGMFAFLKELPKLLSELFGYNLQENEAIAGVVNQATGVIKGIALGKVGMGMQQGMMWSSAASNIAGGVAAGGKALGVNYNKNVSGGLMELGGVTSSFSSGIGGMLGSNFGNTTLAPLTKGTGSIAQSTQNREAPESYEGMVGGRKRKRDEDKAVANVSQSAEISNSTSNNVNQQFANQIAKDITNSTSMQGFVNSINQTLAQNGVTDSQGNPAKITDQDVLKIISESNGAIDPAYMDSKSIAAVYNGCVATVEGATAVERKSDIDKRINEMRRNAGIALSDSQSPSIDQNNQIGPDNGGAN